MPLVENEFLDKLSLFPTAKECLKEYISYVIANIEDPLEEYDLFQILERNDTERLNRLEALLLRAMSLLRLSIPEFKQKFGFADDLLLPDPEKIHDVLSEPIIVVNLADAEFQEITKLPRQLEANGRVLKIADLTAIFSNQKFAIEIKTIRTERDLVPGRPTGRGSTPSWWKNMFMANAITKIEDKNRRVLEQLRNTKLYYNCSKTLLILDSRRLGPSTLLSPEDYPELLGIIGDAYPDIDCLAAKGYFDGQLWFWPELAKTNEG